MKKTAAESRYHDAIAKLPCVLCTYLDQRQESRTDVHHIREGAGMGEKSSHWLVAALCHSGCHQGPNGIHGDRSLLCIAKLEELDLLALTFEAYARRVAA